MAKILKSRTCTVQLSDNSWISLEQKQLDRRVQLWPLCSMNFLMALKWLCSCHLELENALALRRQAREVAFFRATSIYNLLHILEMLSPVWMFLFFLNSCVSVIEQFWRELSQATYFPSKGLFAEVLFSSCLYNDVDEGWDGGKWLLVPTFPQLVPFIRETIEGRVSLCLSHQDCHRGIRRVEGRARSRKTLSQRSMETVKQQAPGLFPSHLWLFRAFRWGYNHLPSKPPTWSL